MWDLLWDLVFAALPRKAQIGCLVLFIGVILAALAIGYFSGWF
jgi:hypothetical protein